MTREDAKLIAEELSILLGDRVKPSGKDYRVKDILSFTGLDPHTMCRLRFHGEYRVGPCRMFRREVVDSRRRQGLNLAIE